MSGRMNWRREAERRRMRRQGVEDARSAAPFTAPLLRKPAHLPSPSTTDRHKRAAARFMAWHNALHAEHPP